MLLSLCSPRLGIIYCLTQKDTEGLSGFLNKEGVAAAFYHANVNSAQRERDHIAWLDGKVQVCILLFNIMTRYSFSFACL